jgi:hypothetical protein
MCSPPFSNQLIATFDELIVGQVPSHSHPAVLFVCTPLRDITDGIMHSTVDPWSLEYECTCA